VQPTGENVLSVSFQLPRGWIELPPPGQKPGGLLRRNPYEVLARQLVGAGAVIKPLTNATAAYLERVAAADPGVLGIASYVQALNREEHTFVTFAVFQGPRIGSADIEELAARRNDSREGEHSVEQVDLPWGRAARASFTRTRTRGGEPRPFVQYWVEASDLDHLIIVTGDVDAPAGSTVDHLISDIDSLARTLAISPR
jgi:hypothetical protein